MQRTDIRQSDVFISWTGKDRELKDRIIGYLRQNNIVCTESDHDCAGDFRQWSREAVGKSTVFLLLYTENTVNSEFVPVEIEEFKKLDDYRNRCVPVVADYSLYAKNLSELAESESAVVLDGRELTDNYLNKILYNVQTLINNSLCKVYRETTKPAYLRLVSMLKAMRVADREFDHNRLYIDRTLMDENGEAFASAAEFTNAKDIIFLQGPAGSGKSCYIDQLRNAADDQTLVISLSCRKLVDATDLLSVMFDEFKRYCGNRQFYTLGDFKSLLSVRHLLLVLDGMDEIATEKGTRKFLNTVKDYYVVNSDLTTLFFTSRNETDADLIAMDGQTPRKLMLRSLEEDQIKTFGSNLFFMLGSSDKSDDFYVHIQDLADEIRTNPLLLSQLAIIYDKKNEIPQTTVGIYDAVCEITMSREDDIADVPNEYREMVTRRLSDILKSFSAERYRLLSLGKQINTVKILTVILKNEYTDARDRAAFLEEYLQNRAMLVDGEFYHKMLLEYFTATYYYEQCFNDYDEIENADNIKNLFEHYNDPYWSAVLQMFLVKADSLIDGKTTTKLYRELITYGITEYTLLFDICRDLIRHKEEAQSVLICDILQKSANGIYPPYGPLFWYVPEYELYENLLITLDSVKESDFFAKALALTRDVCWIFGHYNTVEEITDLVNGKALLEKASLSGVRRGLCELFFTGNTESTLGDNIYPRCFNVAEAKSFMKNGCGVIGRMSTPFADELDLFSHTSYNELNDEFIGLISCPYIIDEIENELAKHSCCKLTGLILSASKNTKMEYIAINRRHIRVVYVPENTEVLDCSYESPDDVFHLLNDPSYIDLWSMYMPLSLGVVVLDSKLLYHSSKVSLPEGIKKIPYRVFGANTVPESISLPSSVEKIDKYAFEHCDSLESINIPGSVKKIEEATFSNCNSLISVSIAEGVTKIEECAFWDCRSLISVDIPDSVTEIDFGVFENCHSLVSINLPKYITKIKGATFLGCRSLISVNIPDSVTKIESSAFEGCRSLKSINIPEGVTKIGSDAFEECSSLTSIIIPEGVTEISSETFKNCSSLISVIIPDSVVEIGSDAFEGCDRLQSVEISIRFKDEVKSIFRNISPDSINFLPLSDNDIVIPYGTVKIKDNEFAGKKNIRTITIPETITEIGKNAFEGCCSLKKINIPETVNEINSCVFKDCCSLTSISIPKSITKIGEGAFLNCSSLKSVNIPDGVTKIGDTTFEGCRSLTSIEIPEGVTKIGSGVFGGCSSLESIGIPEGVTEIGSCAFKDCRSLTSVDIPDSVIQIGSYAFEGCRSLTFCDIPDSVTEIGRDVFKNCDKMWAAKISIRFKHDIKHIFGNIYPEISFHHPLEDVIIPCGTTEIKDNEFFGQMNIKTITIPEGVTRIGNRTFGYCYSLTSINIPDGVTEIGNDAFFACKSLKSINIPASVTKIGFHAFFACESLTSVNIPDGITEIRAFGFCSSLTSINIPKSVTQIGDNAFEYCCSLISINIPDGVTEIGDNAFSGCSSLTSVNIPNSVTKIANNTFSGCSLLTAVIVPDGVTEIGTKAFHGCSALTSVNIPYGTIKINEGLFENCSSLTSIYIPDSVIEVSKDSFKNCSLLTSIKIMSTVRVIGDDAFKGCTGLREITISRRFEDDLPRIFVGVDLSQVKINWL